jgi:hypothetical protein
VLRIENMLALHPEIEGSLESVTSDHMRVSPAGLEP